MYDDYIPNPKKDGKLRILITGSRIWDRPEELEQAIFYTIESLLSEVAMGELPTSSVTIVHGGAKGADTFALLLAKKMGFTEEVHRPEYDKYPPRQAPLDRNRKMVNLGADICLAFTKGKASGTRFTIDLAVKANIPTYVLDDNAIGLVRVNRSSGDQ